ncbi:MAG: hypothetical protein SPE31_07550 [Prevotella sp.]|nr:hypothetical protein [Prevotella sp.]
MEKKEQVMKKKKYIMPDITIIPMDEEVKLLDHISDTRTTYGASDTGVNKSDFGDLQAGENLGQGPNNNAPAESKNNQMWDLWEY